MKITGTRSYILIEFDHRSVKILGELASTPVFYAYMGSIKNWEPPYENVPVSDDEKKEIVQRVNAQKDMAFKIIFED